MTRPDGRALDELRPVTLRRGVQEFPAGSVEIHVGRTVVLCAATVNEKVPGWMVGKGRGWVTAEYAMLPGAVSDRASRVPGGRAAEIQRLVGRSLRAAVDLAALGERTVTVDCDVVQADGGTRVASITGGCAALQLAFAKLQAAGKLARSPLIQPVAAVSCAVVGGEVVLDPCYAEDHVAAVDANFVVGADGRFIEIQCTAEGAPFDDAALGRMVALARKGTTELLAAVAAALGR
ncbi:MAG TPA: ribonuclease PH [Polyangia bacterium]|jgi:ribonuclease PH